MQHGDKKVMTLGEFQLNLKTFGKAKVKQSVSCYQ